MKILAVVLFSICASSTVCAQTNSNVQTDAAVFLSAPTSFVIGRSDQSEPVVVIFTSGDVLMESRDDNGLLLFTVFRDGHVVVANGVTTKDVDAVSKLFWQEFVAYFPPRALAGYRVTRPGTLWSVDVTSGATSVCALELGPHKSVNFSALITDSK